MQHIYLHITLQSYKLKCHTSTLRMYSCVWQASIPSTVHTCLLCAVSQMNALGTEVHTCKLLTFWSIHCVKHYVVKSIAY